MNVDNNQINLNFHFLNNQISLHFGFPENWVSNNFIYVFSRLNVVGNNCYLCPKSGEGCDSQQTDPSPGQAHPEYIIVKNIKLFIIYFHRLGPLGPGWSISGTLVAKTAITVDFNSGLLSSRAHCQAYKKSFFLLNFLFKLIFQLVIQGVFWKDNTKGFITWN